jgi:membrane protease subunit HflC
MKSRAIQVLLVVVVLVALVSSGAFYVVNEGEQVVITQFGRPVGDPVKDAGLNFKIPFIQAVNRFEKRLLNWDGSPNQIPTKDQPDPYQGQEAHLGGYYCSLAHQ